MKAIALRKGAETPELVDVPKPVPAAGEVLVQTVRTGLCGTEDAPGWRRC